MHTAIVDIDNTERTEFRIKVNAPSRTRIDATINESMVLKENIAFLRFDLNNET